MANRWPHVITTILSLGFAGCASAPPREFGEVDKELQHAASAPAGAIRPAEPMATALDTAPTPPELTGPQPVDAYIRRALGENRMVQAAHYNVLAMRARIPQVTSLDDPVASNVIYPIPSVAPQYSLMGYNPYNLTLAQQFPWFGTLRLRGEAAEFDVKVALAELAAAQLDAVANVKRAYYDLHYNERAEAILRDNRKLAADFVTIAKSRYAGGNSTQQDVLRAEVAVVDLDRELIRIRQGLAEARADLSQQLHVSPEADLRTLAELPTTPVPVEVDRLYRLAVAARPELKGRLAAIARDEKAVELARKRFYPNTTVGLSYMDMEKTNAQTPKTAGGFPNVGLFVGFNLPIYRAKYQAGVCEAQARAVADAKLYDAERDSANREVKNLLTQARSGQDVLTLFVGSILPKARQALEAATSDYKNGNVDYVTLITSWREVLQVELQVAQVEAELRKSLASLERAVGARINAHPPTPEAAAAISTPLPAPGPAEGPDPVADPVAAPDPPPSGAAGPFGPEGPPSRTAKPARPPTHGIPMPDPPPPPPNSSGDRNG